MDLLTVGEAFNDLIFAGLRRLPRLGEELRVPTFSNTIGGGAVITAVAAARLGLSVAVLSATEDDAARALGAERVKLINLRREGEPGAVSIALSTARDRAFVTFEGVNRSLEARALPALRALRTVPRHVHFALSPLNCSAWVPVVEDLGAKGRTTSWDSGWNDRLLKDREFESLLAKVDWVFVNEHEARLYARVRTLGAALRRWPAMAKNTVIKMGPRGAVVLSAGRTVRAPAPRARVVDTTGAGDAFNGGFLTALLRGAGLDAALRLGNYTGARSTEGLGGIERLPAIASLPRWARRSTEAR